MQLIARFFICSLLFFLLLCNVGQAQWIPITTQPADDMLRSAQLLGRVAPSASFTIRPFAPEGAFFVLDSTLALQSWTKGGFQATLLPATVTMKYNSTRPYGWNDGPMRMAAGFQQLWSAGVHAKLGPLEVQIQPEWVQAAQPNYKTTFGFGADNNGRFQQLSLGQSAIQINLGPVAVGAATRNLWWGPGQFSSLMMSNHAPGFQHLFFQSNRPIKTPIGSFEWQLIGGLLNEDTARAMENTFLRPNAIPNKNRYVSAVAVTFQPKWLKGFYLGAIRAEHAYLDDINQASGSFFTKYLQVLTPSSPVDNAQGVGIASDGLLSIFLRWVMPKEKAEVYLEYGYNDFKQNLRDLAANANHSSAYILGFKKIFDKGHYFWELNGELTQMAQSTSYTLRTAGNWYTHGQIVSGFTHQNQLLGAGSGFGNNVQTLQLLQRTGFDYWGVKLQRIQQDPKGILGPFENLGMRPFSWTDWSVGVMGQKRWNRFFAKAELQGVQGVNYGWEKGNLFNLFFQCQLGYLW